MITFPQEIYKLLQLAQSELEASQNTGRTAKNDLSEAHYFAAWVTTAIKQKRFDAVLLPTLKIWQGKARSLGLNAGLKNTFIQLEACYKKVLDEESNYKKVIKTQVLQFCEQLENNDWMVTLNLTVGSRLNRHSDGKHSIIICAKSLEDAFDEEGTLIAPVSIYIRGEQQTAINAAFDQGLLLYKINDYKSKVKYHGEFILYPENNGKTLPELPAQ